MVAVEPVEDPPSRKPKPESDPNARKPDTGAPLSKKLQDAEETQPDWLEVSKSVKKAEDEKSEEVIEEEKYQKRYKVAGPSRRACMRVEHSTAFETAVVIVILANCIFLAMDSPLVDRSRDMLWYSFEVFFTVIFTLEAIVRVIAQGPKRYFTNPWCILDFIIVVTSWPEIFMDAASLSSLRVFRVLRPLKTITRLPSLRQVMQAILRSILGLSQVAMLIFFVFMLYGIVGMQLFGGKLRKHCFWDEDFGGGIVEDRQSLCNDDPNNYYACAANQTCTDAGYNPASDLVGFDNIIQAWTTLLQCATLEGWTDVMYMLWESNGPWLSSIYFLTMVLLLSWFMIELVTGVVYEAYMDSAPPKTENKKSLMSSMISRVNTVFGKGMRKIAPHDAKPAGPTALQKFVDSKTFNGFIISIIAINTIFMTAEYYGQPQWWTDFLYITNFVFVGIFTIEVTLNFVAHGWRKYLSHRMNVLDFVIVLVSLVEIVLEEAGLADGGSGLVAFRALRLLRVFKLATNFKGIQRVLTTTVSSLSQISAIALLTLVFILIFSLLGMQLFAGQLNDEETGESIRFNFDTLGWAFINVFIVMGGENWNELMSDTAEKTSVYAAIYFVIVLLTGQFIILNVFFSIVLSNFDEDTDEDEDNAERILEQQRRAALLQKGKKDKPYMKHSSLFLFDRRSTFRIMCDRFVFHRYFERLIIFVILTSTAVLAWESPHLVYDSPTAYVLRYVDYVSTGIFIIELILTVVAKGMWFHEHSYIRDPWNILAVLVILSSILSWMPNTGNVGWVKAFRALATLKPLRFVDKIESIKVVATSLFLSMSAVANVFSVLFLCYVILGVMGMNFFKGLFYQCEDIHGEVLALDKVNCTGVDLAWKNPDVAHFDHIGAAVLALFEMSSMEMWPDIMLRGMDIAGPDLGPQRDVSAAYAIYFVIVIILGNFFFFSLVSGAVVNAFITAQKDVRGDFLITQEQLVWKQVHRLSFSMRSMVVYFAPTSSWRMSFFKLATHRCFEAFISTAIILNTICLASYTYEGPQNHILDICNYVFFGIFFIEAIIKITALDWQYFGESWNVFDFTIVVLSTLGLIFSILEYDAIDFTVLRAVRAARLVRIIRKAKTLNQLISAMLSSIPALSNVLLFSMVLFFVYGVVGVSAFGVLPYRNFITEHTNFETFPSAFMLLFRSSTGESWNGIMHDAMVKPCEFNGTTDCGSHLAIPYFISFVVLCQIVVVSLFIGIAMEEFESARSDLTVVPGDIRQYHELWVKNFPKKKWYTFVVPSCLLLKKEEDEVLELHRFEALISKLTGPLAEGALKISRRRVDLPLFPTGLPVPRQFGVKYGISVLVLTAGAMDEHVNHRDPELRAIHRTLDRELYMHDRHASTRVLWAAGIIQKFFRQHLGMRAEKRAEILAKKKKIEQDNDAGRALQFTNSTVLPPLQPFHED